MRGRGYRLAVRDDAHDLISQAVEHYQPWDADVHELVEFDSGLGDEDVTSHNHDEAAVPPGYVPLSHFADEPGVGFFAARDCDDCGGDGLTRVEPTDDGDTDTCRCVMEVGRPALNDVDDLDTDTAETPPGYAPLQYFPDEPDMDYFAALDCDACGGDGLARVETTNTGDIEIDTCHCVLNVDRRSPSDTDNQVLDDDPATMPEWAKVPDAPAPSGDAYTQAVAGEAVDGTTDAVRADVDVVDEALTRAETACDRIDAATAHTMQGRTVDTTDVAFDASAGVADPYVAESRGDVDGRGL
ncbi:hypothetical protein ACFQV2_02265 [Actinokineospora soli]|uniref:Uncharacterized protein n=1 Tax=Actinokineospora soli TaxID=1048753 RepID=A0ABW2TGZ0_9PSEU